MPKAQPKANAVQAAADRVAAYIPKAGIVGFPWLVLLPLVIQIIEAIFQHCSEQDPVEALQDDTRSQRIIDRQVAIQVRRSGKGPFMVGRKTYNELCEGLANALALAADDAKPEEIRGLYQAVRGG